MNVFNYDHWQYWEWLLLKVFTQPFYGLNELLQGITSYLSWLWSNLLMYLPRKPFSPMSNGFERSCRKNCVIILCFFAKYPYLKTNGACHLILFSVKDPKEDSMKIFTWFFYVIFQEKTLHIGLLCHRITLCFFFKFVSRANNLNTYLSTN